MIDFTNKSDQEILNHIKETNGSICGRFKQVQLDRELHYDTLPTVIPVWQKVAVSLLFFIGVQNNYVANINSVYYLTVDHRYNKHVVFVLGGPAIYTLPNPKKWWRFWK